MAQVIVRRQWSVVRGPEKRRAQNVFDFTLCSVLYAL